MSGNASLRVLLVEDSSLLAERIAELIACLPEVDLVDTVDNELAALSSIRTEAPDVVILDLHLRSGTGFGVLRSMRRAAAAAAPKFVILSNFGLPEYRREAEALGAEVFLDKSRDYFRLPTVLLDYARRRSTRNH
ncbi:MAG: response regulator, partial [Gammaproteobacteria bacterium]|nr:response regulator [Gammaproteobacteria bacterium]